MTPTLTVPTPTVSPICAVVIQSDAGDVSIPAGITDLASFRHWLHSGTFPEKRRVCFIAGSLWVDQSMERLYAHNQVKQVVGRGLGNLIADGDIGLYIPDGMHLSNEAADLSTEPDGIFVSYATLQSGRVKRIPAAAGVDAVDLEGTPDMVLEVVSDSSATKDYTALPPRYEIAGIPEFWRIDARKDVKFEILRLTPGGYEATQTSDGWWHSDVFGRDFRLTQWTDRLGEPRYTLEMR